MDQLPRLNARLATLSELRDIVRAMRAMAANATREGEAALPAVRHYRQIVDDALADGMALAAEATGEDLAAPVRPRTRLLCLIGTDHGFVGNLNARLVHEAVGSDAGRVFVVGRRAAVAATELGVTVAGVMPTTAHVHTIPLLARQLAPRLASADELRVAFCRHRVESGLSVVKRQVVPIDPSTERPRNGLLPLHHLKPAQLLRAFVGEYLMAEIARALTEAFVGENATRLRVLNAADQNIGDKMDELQRAAQQLRQETITAELLDIVIGAEAVAKAPGAHNGEFEL
jgi:F-type H+-transporting ATPase subunit gamma